MMKWLLNFFKTGHTVQQERIENYLAQSTDAYDLENRMKEIRYKGIWV